MSETKKCKVEGCKRAYRAKGYCSVHFQKWRRGELKAKPRYKTCCEENCRKPLFKFGMCEAHCQSWITSKKGVAPAATAAAAEVAPAAEKTPAAEPTQG